ncbi:MAG: GAF domain-containing SpoIIE family protein phosphatase [Verrucomicrobiota bacterium]
MWTSLLIFFGGFLTATLVAWVFRVRGMKLIRRLLSERAELLGEENRIFTFLHEIGETLSHDQSQRALHEEIVKGLTRVVDADGAALYLLDTRQGTHLVPASLTEKGPALIEIPEDVAGQQSPKAIHSFLQMKAVPITEGLLGKTFEAQGPIHFGALRQWAQLFHRLLPDQGAQYVMAAPLQIGNRRMGVLAVGRAASRGPFSGHAFEVFRSASEQSTFALANAIIQQEAMDKKRMDEELRSASEVQRILLPQQAPELGDYIIAASNLPAKVMSGDYYDFIKLDQNHMGIVIADVSGKGFPASLVMATCRALLRGQAAGELSPTGALSKVNRMLFGDIREDMFISLAYCVLDRNEPKITLSRAGHDAPLHFSRKTGTVTPLKPPGLALGIDGGRVFDRVTKDFTFEMEPGDCLLLYTDGVNEAVNAEGEEFGLERLHEVFRQTALSGAHAILAAFRKAVADFVGSSPQSDDITIIAVEKR